MEPLLWDGKEYEYRERSDDWYWILGIVIVAIAVAAILLKSYVFAVVVITAGFALGVSALKKPGVHAFRLDDHGFSIGNHLYPYEHIVSFAIVEYMDGVTPPRLTIRTRSFFAPELAIPLSGVDAMEVYRVLTEEVEEHEHKDSMAEFLAQLFKF